MGGGWAHAMAHARRLRVGTRVSGVKRVRAESAAAALDVVTANFASALHEARGPSSVPTRELGPDDGHRAVRCAVELGGKGLLRAGRHNRRDLGERPPHHLARQHEREGRDAEAIFFLFMRPEAAPMRAKMLHASAVRPLVTRLSDEYGVAMSKVVEGLERDELDEAELTNQLYVYA